MTKLCCRVLNITLLFIVGLTCLVAIAQAKTPLNDELETANRYYEAEQFAEAVTAYEALHENGLSHVVLYYNMGNAYLQQGDVGRAILNYRRAQILDPRDPQIAENLLVAQQQTIDKIVNTPQDPITGLAYLTESILTISELQLIALVLWVLLMAWVFVMVMWPRRFRNWLTRFIGGVGFVIIGLPWLVIVGSIGSRLYLQQQSPPVVVVSEIVEVTTGPGSSERYPVSFRLHAGSEARLLDEGEGGWQQIILSNNLQGWVPQETIAIVDL